LVKPESQRIAIAEACGWKQVPPGEHNLSESHLWLAPNGHYAGRVNDPLNGLPDYLSDLNAMHEAEKVRIIGNYELFYGDTSIESRYRELCGTFATAAQRAEAFLRTLNLWDAAAQPRKEGQ
jgi:hypothetical protein